MDTPSRKARGATVPLNLKLKARRAFNLNISLQMSVRFADIHLTVHDIGMKILRQGENSYYALLDAGMNWYEAAQTLELYLQDGNELVLTVTQVLSWRSREVRIPLDGLPGTTARLKLHLFMKGENCLEAEVEDLSKGTYPNCLYSSV